jgi:putative transposase
MAIMDKIHTELPATGARKMARELTRKGLPTTRYAAGKLMKTMNIACIYPKPNTSKPTKGHKIFPYLLRDKRIWLPNQVWALDITYVPFQGGHMYLTAIIDWYSRMIVGFRLADSLHSSPVIECMADAFKRYGIPAIANSDQGSHFSSTGYVGLLKENNVAQSMDGKARWVDNKIIERWFRTLKSEYIYLNEFETPRELARGIAGFVEKYNAIRLHESHDYIPPEEAWSEIFAEAA